MTVPGLNVLATSFRLISPQTVLYYPTIGRSLNSVGQDVTAYAAPFNIVGSFQPVPKTLYKILGLDFQKNYVNFFTNTPLVDIHRNVSGDQIVFNNLRYQCESSTPWFNMDKWVAILCVEIGFQQQVQPTFGFNALTGSPSLLNDNGNFYNANFAPGSEGNAG